MNGKLQMEKSKKQKHRSKGTLFRQELVSREVVKVKEQFMLWELIHCSVVEAE